MPEQRCERTELLVDQCAHCLGHMPVEDQAIAETTAEHADFLTTHPRWFPARFPGSCACGRHFEAGTPITGSSWREGGWRAYSSEVVDAVHEHAECVLGEYYSPSNAPYQNACVGARIHDTVVDDLRKTLVEVREDYGKNNIHWSVVARTERI